MNIVLLGKPSAERAALVARLVEEHGIKRVSAVEVLQSAINTGIPLGKKAKACMRAGEPVSDDIVLGLLVEHLQKPLGESINFTYTNLGFLISPTCREDSDSIPGFILDGFPCTPSQAQALDAKLANLDRPLDAALLVGACDEQLLPLADYYRENNLLVAVGGCGREAYGEVAKALRL